MVNPLDKHILEEGGKKQINFAHLEHDILDTLSRYTDVLKSVLKKVDGLGLTTSFSTNISLNYININSPRLSHSSSIDNLPKELTQDAHAA